MPEKKKRGQRGPDKKPRDYAGGRQAKPEDEKAKTSGVTLYDWEREQLQKKYGTLTKAIRTLVKPLE